MKQKFSIEDEPQIFPSIFGIKHRTTYGWKIEGRGIERPMQSGKVEDFSFGVFYYKSKPWKKRWNNIVTTKEKRVINWKRFALSNKKSIVKKW